MSSKPRLRSACLPLLTSLALTACDYSSKPADPGSGDPSGGIGTINGMGGAAAGGAPTGGAPAGGASTEGGPLPGGIAGGATGGTVGAAGASTAATDAGIDAGVASGGAGGTGTVVTRPNAPCDIYAGANTPCVGAYSLVRALSSTYDGPLYQLRRGAPNALQNTGNGGQTQNIGVLPNGFADGAAHIAFCATQTCTISVLYDQSGQGNNLTVAPAGCYGCDFNPPDTACTNDFESTAIALTVGGNAVHGLFMEEHEGYRNNQAVNTPEGEDPAGVYMVSAGTAARPQVAPGCCWNFGIASRENCFGPTGMMASLMFGRGFWGRGAGAGPWFMGDFEAGVWAGGTAGRFANQATNDPGEPWPTIQSNPTMTMNYAFGILKTRPNNYALRMGDAQQGNLTTGWDGATPTVMQRWVLDGGIVLGIGGDNSNHGSGTFFEGVITAGRPSDETDEAVFRNVQAAGYGR